MNNLATLICYSSFFSGLTGPCLSGINRFNPFLSPAQQEGQVRSKDAFQHWGEVKATFDQGCQIFIGA
jgi:hypothetical protein